MSKTRMIDTKFWDDNYCSNLDPIEKLLFLYFLTNTSTNISGIYEIPLKKIAVETGIEKEMVEKILGRFAKDSKVFYYNGWICLKNFVKNQNQKSPKVQIGIKNEISLIPQEILDVFIGYGYPIASNLIKSNLIKSNIELPLWLNKDKWNEWLQYRKESKKKMTDLTIQKQLKFLEKYKTDHVQIIDKSITNGWQGLFAPDNKNYGNSDASKVLKRRMEDDEAKREREASAGDDKARRKINQDIINLAKNKTL